MASDSVGFKHGSDSDCGSLAGLWRTPALAATEMTFQIPFLHLINSEIDEFQFRLVRHSTSQHANANMASLEVRARSTYCALE